MVDELEVKNLIDGTQSFNDVFIQMVDKVKQRGYGEFGLIGEFDKSIKSLLKYDFGTDIVAVLNLQLFVKDYLLTGDEKLKNNISNEIFNFTMVLENHVKDEEVDKVSDILLNYETVFNQLTQVDDELGIYSGKGLQGRLFEEIDNLDNFIKLKNTDIRINDLYEQNLFRIYLSFFLVVSITILAAIIINQRLYRTLVVPIQKMKEIIARMSRGEVPQANVNFKVDDLSEMAVALNNLVRGTRNYQDFAIKIGNGNLNANFTPLSNEDILGNSLLAMRDSLKMNAEENKKRSWAANGLAEISSLIRTLTSDESELFNKVLTFIVKYTASNQGSLFILTEDEESEQYLEMVACYAWDKRKYLEKRIQVGDGLAGQCAIEGEVIYLTDFPANYINITSGLGSASPSALLIVPLKWDDQVVGVLEIASFEKYENHEIDLVKKFSESVAAAWNNQKLNRQTRMLLHGAVETN